jgi:hypothetical protein
LQVAVRDDCTVVAQDAAIPRAGLPVDPAGTLVLRSVDAPEVSSS